MKDFDLGEGARSVADRVAPAAALLAVCGVLFGGLDAGAQQIGAFSASALVAVGANEASHTELPDAPSVLVKPLQLQVTRLAGGVEVQREQPTAIPLTIDQAVALGLQHNTELILRAQQERFVHGQVSTVENALFPGVTVSGYSRAQEINLAAMGFKASTIANIPGFTGTIAEIVKVNTTEAQVSLTQQANLPALYLYRAAAKAGEAANWATLSARGSVVLQVGSLYLQALADEAQVKDAQALVKQDEVVYEHAKASRDAGVGINLDVLRAQVDLQNEQQALVRSENAFAKDKIQLNRAMGQPAGQALELTDTVPFAEFDADSSDDALKADLAIAYERRKDLRGLEAQLQVAVETSKALKWERLPILGVGGYYGVLGETTGLYHGVFAAEGKISIPVFQEATLRGQKEVSAAQERGLRQQIDARKSEIEGDIRSSLLDVQSSRELVKVARSNVALASQALSDATDRFTSGVDDNLAVVRAQAELVGAETQVIQAEFQYNYAKLQLARNTGVVETQYKRYLGQ